MLLSTYTVLTIRCLCYFRIKLFSLSVMENIQPGSMLEQNLRYEIFLNDAKLVEDMKKNIRIPRLTGIDSQLSSALLKPPLLIKRSLESQNFRFVNWNVDHFAGQTCQRSTENSSAKIQ